MHFFTSWYKISKYRSCDYSNSYLFKRVPGLKHKRCFNVCERLNLKIQGVILTAVMLSECYHSYLTVHFLTSFTHISILYFLTLIISHTLFFVGITQEYE